MYWDKWARQATKKNKKHNFKYCCLGTIPLNYGVGIFAGVTAHTQEVSSDLMSSLKTSKVNLSAEPQVCPKCTQQQWGHIKWSVALSHRLQSCSGCCFTSFSTTNIHTVSPRSQTERATVSCAYTFLSFRVGFTLECVAQTSNRLSWGGLRVGECILLALTLMCFFLLLLHNYLLYYCAYQFCWISSNTEITSSPLSESASGVCWRARTLCQGWWILSFAVFRVWKCFCYYTKWVFFEGEMWIQLFRLCFPCFKSPTIMAL